MTEAAIKYEFLINQNITLTECNVSEDIEIDS
jgi:hypothetical protein